MDLSSKRSRSTASSDALVSPYRMFVRMSLLKSEGSWHDTDGASERSLRHMANVLTIDEDAARLDVVEAVQQTQHGRLPAPDSPTKATLE